VDYNETYTVGDEKKKAAKTRRSRGKGKTEEKAEGRSQKPEEVILTEEVPVEELVAETSIQEEPLVTEEPLVAEEPATEEPVTEE
jgi:hypothetical protein